MPTFRKRVRFYNLTGARSEEMDALVDTGASFSQIPGDVARRLGLTPFQRRRVRLADGRAAEAGLASVLTELPDRAGPAGDIVIIGPDNCPTLLGVHSLDGLGLGVDTKGEQLIEKVYDLLLQTNWPTI